MLNSKKTYKIKGMTCDSCAKMIELDLEDAGHICKCSYATETLEIEGDHDIKKVIDIIKKAGYTLEK
ncbi:MAG: cation transporter [Patescibacteria group bacterium]